MRGEALDDLLLEGADHHQVAHARDHLRRVLDRLAAPELRVTRVQVDRRAAELVHARLERQARARRLLLEDHRQRAVLERPVALVALEAVLDRAGAREQMLVLLARKVLELQEVAQLHRRRFSINALPPWAARRARGSSAPAAPAARPPCGPPPAS